MPMQTLHKNSFSRLFKGRTREEISRHTANFLSQQLSSLFYQPVIQRLKNAQKAGDHVLILSSSPDFLVGEIASRLLVERWRATTYAFNHEGRFCGVYDVMDGECKAQNLKKIVAFLLVPLSSVTVYSDDILDLPLLRLAGQAICVCPNKKLKNICKQNGWEII